MPPRTRSVVKRELAVIGSDHGLLSLPLELLHQIVSHAQGAPIPCLDERPLESPYRERRETLRALCRVCHSLRLALLPLFWENLEACAIIDRAVTKGNNARATLLAKELLGLLAFIIECKSSYASYVKVVNVALEPKIENKALPQLAHALELMPNVHTVQIICKGSPRNYRRVIEPDRFREAFKGRVYPSIRRVVLPYQAHTIFTSFPEVEDVYMNSKHFRFSHYVDYLSRFCPKVERLGWIEVPWESRAHLALENFRNIRSLEYRTPEYRVEEVQHLACFPNLEEATLIIDPMDPTCKEKAMALIEAAQTALAASRVSRKQLKIKFPGETATIIFDGTTVRHLNLPSALNVESVLWEPKFGLPPT